MHMVDAIKPLYTAHGTAIGGRNGHTRSDDGIVDLDLSVPKEMGGPGKPNTGTPEHLFSASKATVKCAVTIGPREKGGFGLAVVLDVTDMGLPQAELQSLAEEAHEKICPYSHATRGNVDVKLVTHGA
jgi:lipoyl-dependent peroxiredoxin